MATFSGTMRIEGERGAPLPVRAQVEDNQLMIETGGTELGSWPLAGLTPQPRGAGVGLVLDGDPVVLDVGNADAFMVAVVGRGGKAQKGRGSRRNRKQETAAASEARAATRVRRRPSPRVMVAGAVVLAVLVAAILRPEAVGSVFLLIGLLLLITAALAVVEPKFAVRMPFGLEATHLMVGAASSLLAGAGLVFFT